MTSCIQTEIKVTTQSRKTHQSIETVKDVGKKLKSTMEGREKKIPHFKQIPKILIVPGCQDRKLGTTLNIQTSNSLDEAIVKPDALDIDIVKIPISNAANRA